MAQKTLTEFADEAARATSRWYGRVAYWSSPGTPYMSCRDWFLQHWRQHPRSSPDGGSTIEHELSLPWLRHTKRVEPS
jgi:hypothetical protein